MKAGQYKQRFSLTILFALVVFCVLVISLVVAALTVYILIWTGVISKIGESVPSVTQTVAFMALISLVVGVGIAMVSSKVPLSPLNRVISQLNRLASGDYKARLKFGKPLGAYPSFIEMAESFNKMAEELENTELLRSDFINNFSHEFKTPIVSIAGFAKLLRRGNLTAEQQEEYLAIIEEESLRLATMATSVLELTKVENQTILTDVSQFNVSEQVRSAIVLLEEKWSKKNLEFNLRLDEVNIWANEELLKLVWINLLDNAIKFSEEYGSIDCAVQEREDRVRMVIRNAGRTIPPESIGHIFTKFYQADESRSSQGSGIGLAVVKKVVQLHGGSVSAESTQTLTTFVVELPKNSTE